MSAAPAPSPSPGSERRTAWLMVAVQFGLIAAVVLLPSGDLWPTPAWLTRACRVAEWAGLVVMAVAALGLGRGLTAAPLPNAHARLRTGGLYRFARHPIYSGLLLFAVAQAAASGSALVVGACAALVALITVKARWEERRLVARFPDYAAYAARTPRFVPGTRRR